MRALVLAAAFMLASCSILDTKVQGGYETSPAWNAGAAFTTADVRVITQRPRAGTTPGENQTVICSEPGPDVATALAAAFSASASGGSGSASGSLSASGQSAEAVAELAGRSTALLGLRDGLFRACEAYANGIIGKDAYGMILSHYGQLMTTLFLAQDVTGAAGTATKAAQVSAALQALQSGNSSNGGSSSGGGTSGTGKSNTKTTAEQTSDAEQARHAPAANLAAVEAPDATPDIPMLIPAAAVIVPKAPAQTKPVQKAATEDAKQALADNGTAGAGSIPPAGNTSTTGAAAANASTAAALVLARMNEDYLNSGVTATLLVACINAADSTRGPPTIKPKDKAQSDAGNIATAAAKAETSPASGRTETSHRYDDESGNWYLNNVCNSINTLTGLQTLVAAEGQLAGSAAAAHVFVNPEVVAAQATQTQKTSLPAPSPAKKQQPNATIAAVQTALNKLGEAACPGCYAGPVDGLPGKYTTNAVSAYQKQHDLTVNGNPTDPNTVQKLLGTPAASPAARQQVPL